MNYIHTPDLKLASILAALGIPLRKTDPVTWVVEDRDGKKFEQYSFWFDVEDGDTNAKAKELIAAYYACGPTWAESKLDKEHPLYYMKGALENREALLHWMRAKVVPMRIIQHGDKTVLLSERASEKTKAKIKNLIS